ncbi:MAG: hypothetical protein L3J28_05075 [Candidatus Polarisedimenticolaceae bacterium]|nr:hypothetical protein [Candidatus Polarisedimenticolaceae bacterium]
MSDCCSKSAPSEAAKNGCPACEARCKSVESATILHHLKKPWATPLTEQHYYFCDSPTCEVVYFGQNGTLLKRSDLRTVVGIKEGRGDAPLCYCFNVSKFDAVANPAIFSFVMEQTKKGLCSCTTSNPSGRCCLKDFPSQRDSIA